MYPGMMYVISCLQGGFLTEYHMSPVAEEKPPGISHKGMQAASSMLRHSCCRSPSQLYTRRPFWWELRQLLNKVEVHFSLANSRLSHTCGIKPLCAASAGRRELSPQGCTLLKTCGGLGCPAHVEISAP